MGRRPSLKEACLDCRTITTCIELRQCRLANRWKRKKPRRKPARPPKKGRKTGKPAP